MLRQILIKDVIESIVSEIQEVIGQAVVSDPVTTVEAEYAYDALLEFLQLNKQSTAPISASSLRIFEDYLSQRWLDINGTDSSYLHAPRSKANLAFYACARSLTGYLNLLTDAGYETYSLLMPPVANGFPYLNQKKLSSYNLHQFVLTDDSEPIDVVACLQNALRNSTTDLFRTNNKALLLNDDERMRVINHSEFTQNLYLAFGEDFIRSQDQRQAANAAYEKLVEAMRSDNYSVAATYGKQGKHKQIKLILKYLDGQNEHDLPKMMDKFTQALEKLDSQEWVNFMQEFSDSKLKGIFKNEGWENILNNSRLFLGNERQHKMVILVALELYWRERAQGGDFTTTSGWVAHTALGFFESALGKNKRLIGGHNKSEILTAVNELRKFLMSDRPLNEYKNFADTNPKLDPLLALKAHLKTFHTKLIALSDNNISNRASGNGGAPTSVVGVLRRTI